MTSHRHLLREARSHMTREEFKARVSPFSSAWYVRRKARIAKAVKAREATAKYYAKQRREAANASA